MKNYFFGIRDKIHATPQKMVLATGANARARDSSSLAAQRDTQVAYQNVMDTHKQNYILIYCQSVRVRISVPYSLTNILKIHTQHVCKNIRISLTLY